MVPNTAGHVRLSLGVARAIAHQAGLEREKLSRGWVGPSRIFVGNEFTGKEHAHPPGTVSENWFSFIGGGDKEVFIRGGQGLWGKVYVVLYNWPGQAKNMQTWEQLGRTDSV